MAITGNQGEERSANMVRECTALALAAWPIWGSRTFLLALGGAAHLKSCFQHGDGRRFSVLWGMELASLPAKSVAIRLASFLRNHPSCSNREQLCFFKARALCNDGAAGHVAVQARASAQMAAVLLPQKAKKLAASVASLFAIQRLSSKRW